MLERDFAQWLTVVPSAAGLHLAARLVRGVSVEIDRVVRRAHAAGVAVHALSDFCGESRVHDGLVVGYSGIAVAKIDEGLKRLTP